MPKKNGIIRLNYHSQPFMNTSRRQFIQSSVAGATAAAIAKNHAADPYAPAEGGLAARLFDKNRQHVLPAWAFTKELPSSLTPVPTQVDSHKNLKGKNGKEAFGDGKAVGEVLHGVAMEWNGTLIGGNTTKDPDGNPSAWETMKMRVKPTHQSEYNVNAVPETNLDNWEAYGKVRCYKVVMKEVLAQLRRDAVGPALLYSYAGMVPGPMFRFRHGVPCVVRFENLLQTETSIHHHGGHTPSHSDGFPSFYVLQNEARDYLYPNILPLRLNEAGESVLDYGEGQSTTWYHDHGLDATAFNVSHGLAGFALWFDDLELDLIRRGVLPGLRDISGNDYTLSPTEYQKWNNAWFELKNSGLGQQWVALMTSAKRKVEKLSSIPSETNHKTWVTAIEGAAQAGVPGFYGALNGVKMPGVGTPYFNPYDIPIALQDRVVDLGTGQIVYDSDGHNGYIGNTQLLNGEAWPVLRVKRRKYRFRLLDGSNARIYRLRFLDSETFRFDPNEDGELEPANITDAALEANAMDFLRIGKDSWLWAKPRRMNSVMLNMANRADLILDFDDWFGQAKRAGRLLPGLGGKGEAVYYMVNTMPQFDGRGPKGPLAEDAGDPQVFPLPFTLDPANPVVAQMRNAGLIPADFFGGGALGQMRELNQPIGLMKIIIEDDPGLGEDASVNEDTFLRPRHTIKDEEVMAVREFVFERGKGAWMINARFYDPTISNANPISGIKAINFKAPPGVTFASVLNMPWEKAVQALKKAGIAGDGDTDAAMQVWKRVPADLQEEIKRTEGDPAADLIRRLENAVWSLPSLTYAEEWILRNGGGGWWHPIHIHLEGHQLVGYEKDFAADGLIDGDGVLGAAAQANMVALPRWGQMVTRFGIDPLIRQKGGRVTEAAVADPSDDVGRLNLIRELLLEPDRVLGKGGLNGVLLDTNVGETYRPTPADKPVTVIYKRGAPLMLKELRASTTFRDAVNALAEPLRRDVNGILDGLQQLALQWVGEMTGNHDTQALGPNTVARIRMRFRTFSGPFVFHCHNVEHEDMRMMVNFEPTLKLKADGSFEPDNTHDPDVYPTARTHGQDVTDLRTNTVAIGELPWSAIDEFANWEEKPVPYTPVKDARDPLIQPRRKTKK